LIILESTGDNTFEEVLTVPGWYEQPFGTYAQDVDGNGQTELLRRVTGAAAVKNVLSILTRVEDGIQEIWNSGVLLQHSDEDIRDMLAVDDTNGDGRRELAVLQGQELHILEHQRVGYLDIKPGACPNPLNRHSHGMLTVAICGTPDFDVTQIDPQSLVLARTDDVGGSVTPLMGPPGPRIRVQDAATPFEGEPCDCHDLHGDGIDDLVMKFETELVVAGLQLNDLSSGMFVELVLNGELSDGTPFSATDCIVVRGRSDSPPGAAE
jgi:hypothetical protein